MSRSPEPSVASLFKPFKYKSLNMRNRLVMAPMTRQQSPDGLPGQDVADYYERRAQGEVGLILSEGTVIDRPASSNEKDVPHFYGQALSGWKKVIDGVHKHNGQMGPQIWHMGVMKPSPSGWLPPGPFEGPASMTVQDIETTIKAYAQSAAHAKELGFDCVELHGAHGYLIDQFFWNQTNTRTDSFGGKTLGERTRFAVDVIKAVRQAVGPDLALIIRLSQWKPTDYGAKLATTPAEMESWLTPMVNAGVDIFHCSQRRFWENEFSDSDLNFAGWAKKITGRPTITVGSVGLSSEFTGSFRGEGSQPQDLSELMRRYDRGDFDLVAVGRALLQDPQWVQKVKENRTGELETFTAESLKRLF